MNVPFLAVVAAIREHLHWMMCTTPNQDTRASDSLWQKYIGRLYAQMLMEAISPIVVPASLDKKSQGKF